MHRLSKFLAVFILSAGILLLAATPSEAGFKLVLTDNLGNTSGVISDGGGGDSNPVVGAITWIGAVGNFTVNVTTGISKPVFPNTPTEAKMDLNSVNVAIAGPGTLTIEVTDTDFSLLPNPQYVLSHAFGGTIAGTGSSATFESFVNASNAEFDTSGAVSITSGPFGPVAFSDTQSKVFSGSSPFSVTQRMTISFGSGGGSYSGDGATTVFTPAPAALVLLASGMPVLGLGYWVRRKKMKLAA
jgi:hypothetical protein